MKHVIILSIVLISCIACGCIGSDDEPAIEEKDEIKNDVMICYDKEIDQGKYDTYYIIVFVADMGNSFQCVRCEDPSIYTKVEIGSIYNIEYETPYQSNPNDIRVLNIVECYQGDEK